MARSEERRAWEAGVLPGSFASYLPAAELSALLQTGARRIFAAGEVLHREEDPSSHVHLLIKGRVRVSVESSGGRVVLLALRGPGDLLGELAALNDWPRTATVRSIDQVEVMQYSGSRFRSIVADRPVLCTALLRSLSGRLRDAEAARIQLATTDVNQRVAAHLTRLSRDHGIPTADDGSMKIDIPLTQQDIADQLGTSRRAVARALSALRARGIVQTSPTGITLRRGDLPGPYRPRDH